MTEEQGVEGASKNVAKDEFSVFEDADKAIEDESGDDVGGDTGGDTAPEGELNPDDL